MKGFINFKTLALSLFLFLSHVAFSQTLESEQQSINDIVTVNINSDDAETIAEVLNGVGMVRAEAIVNYREENGPFLNLDDLGMVRGVGESTIEKNREKILFE